MQNKLVDAVRLSHKYCLKPISCHLAYATDENFLGRIVAGYNKHILNVCIMEEEAAHVLCQLQNDLLKENLSLHVFDSYRPLCAVKDFGDWMNNPNISDTELKRKKIHYPNINKNQLASLGYVADCVSNHCFGDTVDLSLFDHSTKRLLNMGACFDYFDELAYPDAPITLIGSEAYTNRQLLTDKMQQFGFLPYAKEYWHFTFKNRNIKEPLDKHFSEELLALINS